MLSILAKFDENIEKKLFSGVAVYYGIF